MPPDEPALPSPITVPARTATGTVGSPAQQAFQAVILSLEGLRTQLRELQAGQAEARRRYWQQVGPVAATVVAARRALYAPLEEALLLGCFSRAEEQQLTAAIVGNARALQERFGEDEAAVLAKYAPARRSPAETAAPATAPPPAAGSPARPPHEQAAAQARARRHTKAEKAREAAAQAEQQRLLASTKTVYRQLARTHHPDLERDPTRQLARTAQMQRITAAYEADDLFALLQLLAEGGAGGPESDDVLARYTQALLRQQTELKLQVQALKFNPDHLGGSAKKQERELRQLKRDLRAEADYLAQVQRLLREPAGLRQALRTLAAQGQETF